jgi:hypothetical protein
MRPEGPAPQLSAAPSALILNAILSRPGGRAYLLAALRASSIVRNYL